MAGKNKLVGSHLTTDGITGDGYYKTDSTAALVQAKFTDATDYADDIKDDVKDFLEELDALAYRTNEDRFDLDFHAPEHPTDPGKVDRTGVESAPQTPTFDGIPDVNSVHLEPLDPIGSLNYTPIGSPKELLQIVGLTQLDLSDPDDLPELDDLIDVYSPNVRPIEFNLDDIKDPKDAPNITLSDPDDLPELDDLIDVPDASLIDYKDPPELTCCDINTDGAPDPFTGQAPDGPPQIKDLAHLTDPVIAPVIKPTLDDISMPDDPDLGIPTFEVQPPELNLEPPNAEFIFTEAEFISDIRSQLTGKLTGMMDGSDPMVLSGEVIADILSSASGQIDLDTARASDEILEGWSKRGWDIPQGAMVGRIDELNSEASRNKAQVVRDIGVKQSELAIDAIKQALSVGVQYEQILVSQFNDVQARAFEQAKIVYDTAFKIFESQVTLKSMEVEIYKSEAAVYNTLVQGILAKYTAYKTAVEAASLKLGMQKNQIDIYIAELQASDIEVKIFESKVRVLQANADIERLKIEGFKAEIEGFTAKINAKTAEFSGYESKMRAEAIKGQIASAKSQNYTAQVQGISAYNSAEEKRILAFIEKNRGIASGNSAKAEMYKANVVATSSRNDIELTRLKANTEINSNIGVVNQIAIEEYKAKADALKVSNEAEMLRTTSDIETNKGRAADNSAKAEMYKANVVATSSRNDVELTKLKGEVETNNARAGYNTVIMDEFKIESEGKKLENEMAVQKLQADTERIKLVAARNQLMLDSFKAEIMAISAKNSAEGDRYRSGSGVYVESVRAALADYEGVLKKYQADMGRWEIDARLVLEEAKENIGIAEKEFEVGLRASETSAKVYSQLAASSMGIIRANANISYRGSDSNTTSLNRSKQYETFAYSETYKRDTSRDN